MSPVAALCAAVVIAACAGGGGARGAGRARDEAAACAESTETTSALASLLPRVQSLAAKYEPVAYPKGSPAQRLAGVVIHVRPAPGETPEMLTWTLSCHASTHLPERCPAKHRCPFAVDDAHVSVASTGAGFAITIEARDPAGAEEIVRRSRELLPSW